MRSAVVDPVPPVPVTETYVRRDGPVVVRPATRVRFPDGEVIDLRDRVPDRAEAIALAARIRARRLVGRLDDAEPWQVVRDGPCRFLVRNTVTRAVLPVLFNTRPAAEKAADRRNHPEET